jgi:hypothetical protein
VTRREVCDRALSEYAERSSNRGELEGEPDRFLLVEENLRGYEPAVYFSTHETAEAAAHYAVNQEYPEDWGPLELVDLDRGVGYRPIRHLEWEVSDAPS